MKDLWNVVCVEICVVAIVVFAFIGFSSTSRDAEQLANSAYQSCLTDMPACLDGPYDILINNYYASLIQTFLMFTIALFSSVGFVKAKYPEVAVVLLAGFTWLAAAGWISLLSIFDGHEVGLTKTAWVYAAATLITFTYVTATTIQLLLKKYKNKHSSSNQI